jgi:hypothetical protein
MDDEGRDDDILCIRDHLIFPNAGVTYIQIAARNLLK